MSPLPDIPDSDWNAWQAAKFKTASDAAISGIQSGPGYLDSSSPAAFIKGLLPIAQRWQGKTGISASTWLAMAASESNWGKAGTALFGIKGKGTAGSLSSPTWESVNGQRVNITDSFRTYNNPEESFQGFWDFVNENPRYANAVKLLKDGHNSDAFVHAINQAGYATDPNWASSIRNIASTTVQPLIVQSLQTPTKGTMQPAPAPAPTPAPNDAWNQSQRAAFGQAVQSAPDTSAWSSVTVPTDATPQPSFRAHAQAKMDALGGADATQYPADAGQTADLSPTSQGGSDPTGGVGLTPADTSASSPSVFGGGDQQPPTDNANLKDFASYATSKIASLSDPAASTTPIAPLGYNDMAGASSSPGAPAFGANPQDQTSPIEQARVAAFSPTAAPPSPPPVASGAYTGPAPYNDMAGVNTAPAPAFGANPQDATSPIEQTRQAGTLPQLLPGPTPLTDVANATGFPQWAAANRARYGAAYTPQLGTIADQPAREQPIASGFDRGYTPSQVTAQNELATNMALGTVGEVPEALGKFAAPLVADAGKVIRPAVESFANHAAQVIGEAPPAVAARTPSPLAGPADKLIQMYTETPRAVPQSPEEIASKAGTAFVNAWSDRGVAWNRWQQDVTRTLGRPLKFNEMSAELYRLNPDMAARVRVQEGLQPAIQAVPEQDLPLLSSYITAQHNLDVAKAIGEDVKTAALKVPLGAQSAEQRVRSLNGQLRQYQKLRDTAAAAGDGTGVTHYDQLIAENQKNLGRANKLALRQVTGADAERTVAAQAKGSAAEANRLFSGDLNAAQSQQALDQLTARMTPTQLAAVQRGSDLIDKYVGQIRQRMVESGMWKPELAADLQKEYPHYNPTVILDYQGKADSIASGTSISVRDQGLKKLTVEGTAKGREDPLASLATLGYQTEALAKKNEAFNAFVRLNEQLPKGGQLRVIREVPDSYTPINTEAKISGFVDGVKKTYVMPKDFNNAITQSWQAPVPAFHVAMSLYKGLQTALAPAFVAGQVPLDAMSYIIRESVRGGGPQALPAVLRELFKGYGEAFRGIGSETYHGAAAEFLKGGGGFAGYWRSEPGQAQQTIHRLAQRPIFKGTAFELTRPESVQQIVKDVLTFKPVSGFGERAELAPRIGSMRLAQQRGLNKTQAIINGRTVTVDFDQGGVWAKTLNQAIPFLNPTIQAMAVPSRTIRENPRAALATFVTYLAAPTAGVEVWNNADPQRKKDYEDVPQYVKDRSLVIMIPGAAIVDAQGERHPQYIEIRAREYAPLVMLTREAMGRVLGNDARSWQSLLTGAVNSSTPINTESGLGGIAGSLMIPGVSTAADLGANKSSYTGAYIATKGTDERASNLSKSLASGINTVSDAVGGGLNLRPSQVEFAQKDILGGPGQLARDASNLLPGHQGSGLPQDTPLIGQVTKRFVGGSVGQRLQTAQNQRMSSAVTPILRDAGIYDITPVADHVNNGKESIPLSNDEQAYYQELVNISISAYLPRVAAHPDYQKLSSADKAAQLQYWMDKIRKASAEATLKVVDPGPARERMRLEQTAKAG